MAARPRRIYYWIHHTGQYDGNTGVQRVVRALGSALVDMPDVEIIPVCWCSRREAIVRAGDAWTGGLARHNGPKLCSPAEPDVPLHLAVDDRGRLESSWLLLAEVPHVGGTPDAPGPMLPVALDYARYHRLRCAVIFYDLIPLRAPGYAEMAVDHAGYAAALAGADVVLPISRTASDDLLAWWRDQGHDLDRLQPPRPILLAAEMVGVERTVSIDLEPRPSGPIRLLTVGTVEPRKNQLAVMHAVARLKQRRPELEISLDVVGGVHHAVAAEVRKAVSSASSSIRLHGFIADGAMRRLMAECDATIFLSTSEGFGLPVTESLWHGKPCLCSNIGSMAEIALGGGCLQVDPYDRAAIEEAIERIAADPALRGELAGQAVGRKLSSWDAYARAVLAEVNAVPPVPLLAIIEGSRGGGTNLADAFAEMTVQVWAHHWRPDIPAILPGFRQEGEAKANAGRGDLHRLWAILPFASMKDAAEMMRVRDEAERLGLKVAILVEAERCLDDTDIMAIGERDLVLFASEGQREATLARALRMLARTSTVRYRMRVASNPRAMLEEIAAERPRITMAVGARTPRRLFYFCGLTASQPFNTGVQRVTRALARELGRSGIEVIPVKLDETSGRIVSLSHAETEHLAKWNGPAVRPPQPLPDRLAGEWLLVPEVTVPSQPVGSNIAKFARDLGMRTAAVFYDLIPLKLPQLYPPEMLPLFEQYWKLFSEADVALPISWTVAADLGRYLSDRGLRIPAIATCPLAGDLPDAARVTATPAATERRELRLIAIGTREPRKNYDRIVRAVMEARKRVPGCRISLEIVGRRAGFQDLDRDLDELATEAGDVAIHEEVSDSGLLALVNNCDATIYGSWEEGFGLPVLESLWRGLPCLCHDGSAMAEVAPGGGTLALNMLDEGEITQAISRLAGEDGLLDRLREEALVRPIRTWEDYAADVAFALGRIATSPGWPLAAVLKPAPRPLLSCAITTYNRAHWLAHSLPRLLEAARPFGDRVEVVVCDNTSTDATPDVAAIYAGTPGYRYHRNEINVGMLGNLGATVRVTSGSYVWLIGDDDLIMDGAIGSVLEGLEAHPDVEMAYMNYAYTSFDNPEQLTDVGEIVRTARSIGYGGANRRVDTLKSVAALNENLFTAIYACAFRRDHALRAYQQDIRGPAFSSLLTCIPSSVYALNALQDRPAWWVGTPTMVVNMNVSWLRWALLWHLQRMPDLFEAAELAGIDPIRVDRHRVKHCAHVAEWTRMALMQAEDAIRTGVSVQRLIEQSKHLPVFQSEIPRLKDVYREAWENGRASLDTLDPGTLFETYGL